jgi:hypothetical protein
VNDDFFIMVFEEAHDSHLMSTIEEVDFIVREEAAHKHATQRVEAAALLMSIKNRKRLTTGSKYKS